MLATMSVAESTPQAAVLHDRLNDMRISNPTVEKNGRYFIGLLDAEINLLTCLCQKAEMDLRYNVMSEEVSGCVRTAIGKSQLLLKKKFKQFRQLCEDNLTPRANEKEIMSGDLQGFWDLMSMPIEDVHRMFEDVEKLRKNKWQDSGLLEVVKKKEPSQSPRTKQKTAGKPKPKKSNEEEERKRREVRERIAEAKKKAKQRMSNENAANGNCIVIEASETINGVE